MPIKEDLSQKVSELVRGAWVAIPNARVIPSVDDLTFGNSGERLDVTVWYADISGSTGMVDSMSDERAAEYYKAFLHCASQLAKRHGGSIQAYDGDRVMAIFVGDTQADDAVSAALELHAAVIHVINKSFNDFHQIQRTLKFTVGIDSGRCLAIKVGVRGVGEITWVGSAANHAAKLNSFEEQDHDYPIRITPSTFSKLRSRLSLYSNVTATGVMMWAGLYEPRHAPSHYRTNYFRYL